VGHETDWTIADFVADRRAPTPSAAAEMVAPERDELSRRVLDLRNRVAQGVLGDLEEKKKNLKRLFDSYAFRQPADIIEQYTQRLDEIIRQMINYSDSLFREKKTAFQAAVSHLEALSPLGVLARGYSLTLNEKGHAIRSIKEVKAGVMLKTRVSDGTVESLVKGVEENERRR
jgi:exodeoxyribonuclease VII large subunit